MSIPRHNWRDCEEWVKMGMPLSTTSNTAAKMLDAIITQIVSICPEQSVGGFDGAVRTMMESDPNFVLGHAVKIGLSLGGGARSHHNDPNLHTEVQEMVNLAKKSHVSEWEWNHVEAVRYWAQGNRESAVQIWHDILLDHPHDVLALTSAHASIFNLGQHVRMKDSVARVLPMWNKTMPLYGDDESAIRAWQEILLDHPRDVLALASAHASLFYLGQRIRMRDSLARVLPMWNESMPLYGYLLGIYAFGLEECNQFAKAEEIANQALSLNPYDTYATHARTHCMEMNNRADEGIEFLKTTESNWKRASIFASHNYWHWSLFHLEKGQYDQALELYDAQISEYAKPGSLLAVKDATSLLFRLQMEGVNVGVERWEDIYEVCRPHLEDHALLFNDVHLIMACLGAKKKDVGEKFIQSMKDYIGNMEEKNQKDCQKFGVPMLEAMSAYDDGDYARATELARPVRHKLYHMGGSKAQLDIFHQFLVHTAMKSPEPKHQKLSRSLIFERQAMKPDSKLNERLMAKYLETHEL